MANPQDDHALTHNRSGLDRPHDAGRIKRQAVAVYEAMLEEAPTINGGNFSSLTAADVECLFELVDQQYFQGHLRESVGDRTLSFRVSKRLTSSGGVTKARLRRSRRGQARHSSFEIAVSQPLLLGNFEDSQAEIRSGGIICRDRLQALQRIMEHEVTHLWELLMWQQSSCRGKRFQQLCYRYFGHTDHRHALLTARERAHREKGIGQGSIVRFDHRGRQVQGIVNRITRRATVLVPDAKGRRYSDGRRYQKFYVPLECLQRVDSE